MSKLEILTQVIVFSSRSTCLVCRCATLAFSVLKSETILNGFLKNPSFGSQLNLYICSHAWNSFDLDSTWVKNSRWCHFSLSLRIFALLPMWHSRVFGLRILNYALMSSWKMAVIIRTAPILEMMRAYGVCPRLWLLVCVGSRCCVFCRRFLYGR